MPDVQSKQGWVHAVGSRGALGFTHTGLFFRRKRLVGLKWSHMLHHGSTIFSGAKVCRLLVSGLRRQLYSFGCCRRSLSSRPGPRRRVNRGVQHPPANARSDHILPTLHPFEFYYYKWNTASSYSPDLSEAFPMHDHKIKAVVADELLPRSHSPSRLWPAGEHGGD